MLLMKERVLQAAFVVVAANAVLTGCGEDYADVQVPGLSSELPAQVSAVLPNVMKVSATVVEPEGMASGGLWYGNKNQPV